MLTPNRVYRGHSVAKNFSASDPWEKQLSMGWCSTWPVSSIRCGDWLFNWGTHGIFWLESWGSEWCQVWSGITGLNLSPAQFAKWGERNGKALWWQESDRKSSDLANSAGNLGSIVGAYDGPNWCSKHLQPCLRQPRKAVKLNICSQGMQSTLWETCRFWDLQWSSVYCIGMLKTGTQGMYLFLHQQMLYAYVR